MSEIGICTDSSALLPAEVAERFGVEVVPLSVLLDGEEFDERSSDVDDFYARLEAGADAKTSQPSPGAFADAYANVARRGKQHVLSIHLDARISGTARSAELAAREAEIPVTVVDTTTVSFGVGVCVRAAAQALAARASVDEAARCAVELGGRLNNAFVARSVPAGRVSEEEGWAVRTFTNGSAAPVANCGGVDEAIEMMAGLVHHADQAVETAVGHAGSVVEHSADLLAALIARFPAVEGVERYRVGPSVGAHTGSVSFGVFWWPATS